MLDEADVAPSQPDEPPSGDDAGVDEVDAARSRTAVSRSTVALAVAAVVFAVVAVVAVIAAISAHKDSDASKEELKVRTVASQMAEAVTNLSGTGDNSAQADVVHRLGTGPFLAQYDEGVPAYQKLYQATGASAHGDVLGTYVGQVNPGDKEADAVVVVNLVVSGQNTSAPVELYLQVHLVNLGGDTWKVDGLTDVNSRLAATGASSGATGTTTPTTAAGPTPSS